MGLVLGEWLVLGNHFYSLIVLGSWCCEAAILGVLGDCCL